MIRILAGDGSISDTRKMYSELVRRIKLHEMPLRYTERNKRGGIIYLDGVEITVVGGYNAKPPYDGLPDITVGYVEGFNISDGIPNKDITGIIFWLLHHYGMCDQEQTDRCYNDPYIKIPWRRLYNEKGEIKYEL